MSIKAKFIIAFIIMVIISITILLGSFAFLTVNFLSSASFEITKGEDFGRLFFNVLDLAGDFDDVYNNKELLYDEEYMNLILNKLKNINISMSVTIDNELIHSTDKVLFSQIYNNIEPQYDEKNDNYYDNYVPFNDKEYSLILDEINYNDSIGRFYYYIEITNLKNVVISYVVSLILVIIGVFGLITFVLIMMTNKLIIKPLRKIEYGTEQIKNGNLDFSIETKSKGEINKVCNAFERMRKELKNSIEKQLRYEENRKELISSISHDLKTPITSIKGYVEGIKDGVANTPEKFNKYLDVIYSKSIDMDKLIDDLFLFSKLDLDRLTFEIKPVNITKYFNDCIDEMSFELSKYDILLKFTADIYKNTEVLIDQQKLKRVIQNIIQNSIKYMYNDNKKIDINLSEDEKEVLVAIRDNGIGIKEQALPYIFDKFYRTDKARTTSISGSGLGLAIAKQIIERQGGRIYAKSIYGSGTTIFFTLKKVKERIFNEKNSDY